MKRRYITIMGILCWMTFGLVACNESDPVDPNDNPSSEQMSFKSGASYEYTQYSTDPSSGEKAEETERTRRLTLVNTSASIQGETGVAIYVDSVLTLGGIVDVVDSVYLRQESGTNNIYRYASIAPELDFSGYGDLDLGRDWMHEARLGSTSAQWFVGSQRDTIPYDPNIGVEVEGLEVALVDSVVASAVEQMTVNGTSYSVTKTTHRLRLSFSALVVLPIVGTTPIEIKSATLERRSWISADLGAIVREERDGAVIDASYDVQGDDVGITIPIPGYVSVMTEIISK